MKLLYDFSIRGFSILARVFKMASPKLKKLVDGRANIFRDVKDLSSEHKNIAWFHVASLGEFEQAKPVIAKLKKQMPEFSIALTFFSPSGYENVIKKAPENIDFITYIPFDTPGNAKRFLNLLAPKVVFFVKYDLWVNHILEIKARDIPLYLFSASFRGEQIYFRNYAGIFKEALKSFNHIFTQNEQSIDLLNSIGYSNMTKTGDTRFDNVHEISKSPKQFENIKSWLDGIPAIVVGSAWQEDMELIMPFINSGSGYKFIIAPHDIDRPKIRGWQSQLTVESELYSNMNLADKAEVLFIDNIGMLSSLYQYAEIAYVGGAFGKGLHNILEPLAYQIPVLFGKLQQIGKFPEAAVSQSYGCGFEISSSAVFIQTVEGLQHKTNYQQACLSAKKMLEENLGSAQKIIEQVLKEIK